MSNVWMRYDEIPNGIQFLDAQDRLCEKIVGERLFNSEGVVSHSHIVVGENTTLYGVVYKQVRLHNATVAGRPAKPTTDMKKCIVRFESGVIRLDHPDDDAFWLEITLPGPVDDEEGDEEE